MNKNTTPTNTKFEIWIPIAIAFMTMIGGGVGWCWSEYKAEKREYAAQILADQKEKTDAIEARRKLIRDYLQPIKNQLEDTKAVYEELDPYLEPIHDVSGAKWGVLESYIEKAKSNPSDPALPLMNALIGRLIEADVHIDTLLESYAPYVCSDEFRIQSLAFRKHAGTYVSRWSAVPSTIRLKAQLPTWDTFPPDFPNAVDKEIAMQISDKQCNRK